MNDERTKENVARDRTMESGLPIDQQWMIAAQRKREKPCMVCGYDRGNGGCGFCGASPSQAGWSRKSAKPNARLKPVPFTDLKQGDRILVSYGTVTVSSVTITGNRARVEIENQPALTWHKDNWPMLVLPAE